jgi:hypothetical protein
VPAVANPAAAIVEIAERAMTEMALRAVLLPVTVDGEELVTHAIGELLLPDAPPLMN